MITRICRKCKKEKPTIDMVQRAEGFPRYCNGCEAEIKTNISRRRNLMSQYRAQLKNIEKRQEVLKTEASLINKQLASAEQELKKLQQQLEAMK